MNNIFVSPRPGLCQKHPLHILIQPLAGYFAPHQLRQSLESLAMLSSRLTAQSSLCFTNSFCEGGVSSYRRLTHISARECSKVTFASRGSFTQGSDGAQSCTGTLTRQKISGQLHINEGSTYRGWLGKKKNTTEHYRTIK